MKVQASTIPVFADLSPAEKREKLSEMEDDVACVYQSALSDPQDMGFLGFEQDEAEWEHGHHFGFVETTKTNIVSAGCIPADESLRGSRVVIRLNRFYVARYPGAGTHNILFGFSANNFLDDKGSEPLSFNMSITARNKQHAAIIGWPIFRGIAVGPDGMAFECSTVNVKNDEDEKFLSFLNSDVFQGGLDLMTFAQPAIKPLTALSTGLLRMFAQRYRNVGVQHFRMGLDFSAGQFGARLAEGDYIAIQAPTNWSWDRFEYNPTLGRIQHQNTGLPLDEYNYVVFGVSKIRP